MSIQINNLKHIYSAGLPHESTALKNINIKICDNTILGIIGHTGSGKSTLVQHLNGLLKATEGEIIIDGQNLSDEKVSMIDIRKNVGLVFQYPEYQLFDETVEKDISFGPKNLGLDDKEISKRVREAMELVDLDFDEFADKSPFELSGGQKRRVAIAGVIAMKPRVLVLDEPTAGLDPKAHKDILDMIRRIHKAEENITIFVSHNMNDIATISDKVIVMDKGECLLQGSPKEVFANSSYLKDIGLDLPDITQLMYRLRAEGIEAPAYISNVDDAETFITNLIGGCKSDD